METSISHGNDGAGTFWPLQTGGDFAASTGTSPSGVHCPVSPLYVFMRKEFFLWTRRLKLPKEKTVLRTSSAAICEDSSQPRKNIIVNGKSHPYLQVVDVTNMTCVFNKNSLWFCDRRKKKKEISQEKALLSH